MSRRKEKESPNRAGKKEGAKHGKGRPSLPRPEYSGPSLMLGEIAVKEVPLLKLNMEDTTFQPRFSTKPNELLDTIKSHGIQVPLTVRPHPAKKGEYQIICGFRRAAAAKKANLAVVPVIVRDLDEEAAYILSFTENEYHKNLRDLDRAHAVSKLKKSGKTIEEISALFRLSRRQVQRLAKLVEFPREVLKAMDADEAPLPTTHALLIMQFRNRNDAGFELAHWVKEGRSGISVQELIKQIREAQRGTRAKDGNQTRPSTRKGNLYIFDRSMFTTATAEQRADVVAMLSELLKEARAR